tara:strand:+ start:3592 stop:3840 length:249 start_codon:yes stop_codon:yes gene_type:complete
MAAFATGVAAAVAVTTGSEVDVADTCSAGCCCITGVGVRIEGFWEVTAIVDVGVTISESELPQETQTIITITAATSNRIIVN